MDGAGEEARTVASRSGRDELLTLFDYGYWATDVLLDAAAQLPEEQFRGEEPRLTRSLRGTLVHELDVEWSWRLRMNGLPDDDELHPNDYPTVESLAAAWHADEREMRDWLATLDRVALEAPLPGRAEYSLRDVLMHVVTHGMQQRADVAAILTMLGRSPGEIDFLDYLDARRASARSAVDPVVSSPDRDSTPPA